MAEALTEKREHVIKVRSGSATVGLSHVLFRELQDKTVLMLAVGAGAVNQAVKAIGSATASFAKIGVELRCKIALEDGVDYRSDRDITRVTFRLETTS